MTGAEMFNIGLLLTYLTGSIYNVIHRMERQMNCWHCSTELIWGADHSMEDINDGEESEYDFFSTFTCPKMSILRRSLSS